MNVFASEMIFAFSLNQFSCMLNAVNNWKSKLQSTLFIWFQHIFDEINQKELSFDIIISKHKFNIFYIRKFKKAQALLQSIWHVMKNLILLENTDSICLIAWWSFDCDRYFYERKVVIIVKIMHKLIFVFIWENKSDAWFL